MMGPSTKMMNCMDVKGSFQCLSDTEPVKLAGLNDRDLTLGPPSKKQEC